MRRALVLIGLLACTYLEFILYPGHSFLEGESQLLAPMIERLQFPGLLSRDLVATHSILRYTAYDEITLLLMHVPRIDLQHALVIQQLVSRFALALGAFLIAFSAFPSYFASLCVAVLTGLGSSLPGLDLHTVDREPVPYSFAIGFAALAVGLAAGHRLLLAGLFAGIVFVYSPAIGLPLWLCLIVAVSLVPAARPALRPLITMLVVAVLLLGNLVQLQPGAPVITPMFSHASRSWSDLVQMRVPSSFVRNWAPQQSWLYLAISVAALCALYRLREKLNRLPQILLFCCATAGLLSIPFTVAMQFLLPWGLWMYFEPARALVLTVVVNLALCATAGFVALMRRQREGTLWLAATLGLLLTPFLVRRPAGSSPLDQASVASLSSWALQNTWGGSMFFFAGNNISNDPGRFRALSLRPVYVDWEGGKLSRYSESLATDWRSRWDRAADDSRVEAQVRRLLMEPIDYFVVPADSSYAIGKSVFTNDRVRVYDARELRSLIRHSN